MLLCCVCVCVCVTGSLIACSLSVPARATWRMRNFIKLHSCFGKLITKLCCRLTPNELHRYTCTSTRAYTSISILSTTSI